jgi:hypothetical protein
MPDHAGPGPIVWIITALLDNSLFFGAKRGLGLVSAVGVARSVGRVPHGAMA